MDLGGGTYLEIIAPVPGQKSAPETSDLAKLARPTPVFFALRSPDLDATVGLLAANHFATSPIQPGSRTRPDGSTIAWRTTGVTGPGLDAAPFFIEWAKGSPHPSSTSPAGCRLTTLEVLDPAPGNLEKLFSAAGVAIPVVRGERGLRLTAECPKGTVVFGP